MVEIIVPAVTGAVTVTAFLMRWRYGRKRHQETLNDMAREITDYIQCIEEMNQHYSSKFMADSTSEQDKIFYKRLIMELDDNLDKQQHQLRVIIDRITKER
jgi:hypothetical protein